MNAQATAPFGHNIVNYVFAFATQDVNPATINNWQNNPMFFDLPVGILYFYAKNTRSNKIYKIFSINNCDYCKLTTFPPFSKGPVVNYCTLNTSWPPFKKTTAIVKRNGFAILGINA